MSVHEKMKAICDNIRLRTGGTALLNLDEIAAAILTIGGDVDMADWVHNAVGATFPPMQKAASPEFEGYDIDVLNATADDIHSYIDEVVNGKATVTKEIMGKDASGKYDIARYIYANREHIAWVRENYPKMYAWKNGSEKKYTVSVSPRVGDKAYSVPYASDTINTTVPGQAALVEGYRWSASGKSFSALDGASTLIVPIQGNAVPFVIELTGMTVHGSYSGIYGATEVGGIPAGSTPYGTARSSDMAFIDVTNAGAVTLFFAVNRKGTSGEYDNAKITVNGKEIDFVISSTTDYLSDVKQESTTTSDQEITTTTEIVPAVAGFVYAQRYSKSSAAFKDDSAISSLVVPIEVATAVTSDNPLTIAFTGATLNANYGMYRGTTNTVFETNVAGSFAADGKSWTFTTLPVGKWFVCFNLNTSSTNANSATSVPNITVAIGNDTVITDIAIGAASAAFETETTVEGGTDSVSALIAEVKVATLADGATTNDILSSRIIGGVEYVRSAADDVEPTVIYTDMDDERNSNASITQDGITYHRYPLGDLGINRTKLIPIFIYANEHGIAPDRLDTSDAMYQKYETKMAALVAARFMRDLGSGANAGSAFYKYIRENCMVIVIPVANPFGYNMNVTGDTNGSSNGYYNVNNVNSNRNFDTPGWIVSKNGGEGHHGDYPGSENETQYLMNTMVESGAVVAMSLHGIAGFFGGVGQSGISNEYGHCSHQGQNPDGSHYDKTMMDKISDFLAENYGYKMVYYDRLEHDHVYDYEPPNGESINLPDRACKSPSYITQCGAYGGIVEFQPDDIKVSGYQQTYKGYIIENAYAQMLNLTAMWLSDYLEG